MVSALPCCQGARRRIQIIEMGVERGSSPKRLSSPRPLSIIAISRPLACDRPSPFVLPTLFRCLRPSASFARGERPRGTETRASALSRRWELFIKAIST
jgi:hypothetical protein